MGFIQKIFNFIAHPTHLRTAILIIFIAIIIIPLTVIVSQQRQEIRQRAAEPQTIYAPECSPPYDGYLGCLTENGCSNAGISSQVSCSDENVQQGVYCYESTKQGQTCSVNEGSGTCDNQGNCVVLTEAIQETTLTPSPDPTDIPFQSQTPISTPAEEIILPTITSAITQAPTIGIPASTIAPNIPTSSLAPSVPYCYLKSKGDADCDNKITQDDEKIWEQEFVSETNKIPSQKQSDFTSDGIISIVDFNIWKTNYD